MKTKLLIFTLFICLISYSQTQIGADIDGEAANDQSGQSISLSADGSIVAIGARSNNGNGSNSGHVRVYENQGGVWTQIGADIDGENANDNSGISVSLSSDGSIVAIGAYLNDGNGTDSGHVRVYENQGGVWTLIGADINGEAANDQSGQSISLSADGSIVAIGARSNNGNGSNSGHVRVYENQGGVWTQIGADIDGEASGDNSGWSVSLSSDGSIVAIGAILNNGNGSNSGHVRVYKNQGGVWTQIGADIDGEAADDNSGLSVSLSSDGSIVAIGAFNNDGNGSNSGHVRVYENLSGVWTQIGADIDGGPDDQSGYSVSLSSDGSIVAIGSPYNLNDGSGFYSGYVRVYKNQGGVWTQVGVDIDGEAAVNNSGYSVSISSDGSIVAIGAIENSNSNTYVSGHVRVYDLSAVMSVEKDNLFNFSIYPNPSKDKINITLPNTLNVEKIEVFNSLGLLITTTQKTEILTSSYASGVYYIRVSTSEGTSVQKVMIE